MKANLVKIIALCAAAVFVVSTLAAFGPAATTVGAGRTSSAGSPMSVLGTTGDPTLPSGFPAANFSNPQASPPPPVPNTTPVIVPITSFGNVTIPNGIWETVILNVTGYDAGIAYDYFNSFTVNHADVWLGVNPEAGSWAVDVNISQFMSFFDGQSVINVSGTTLGLHQNFRGIQYNNYTLEFYPVPAGQTPPTYPSHVLPLTRGTTMVTIPTDTYAAFIQSIVIDNEFQYTLNPSWAAYTWTINNHTVADSFIYPWINSGGIDLFSWRPIYPPYMLNHQWNLVNLTDALGMIEGNNVPVKVAGASYGPGIGLFVGNLFLFTSTDVKKAVQLEYHFREGPLVNVTKTIPGLVNENGNSYSLYNSYRSIQFEGSSLLVTNTGTVKVSSETSMRYVNLQSLPNSVWQNLSQKETTITHSITNYNETHMHGVVSNTFVDYYPVSFDYGAVLNFLSSSNGLSFYNYTSYFLNVMEAYSTSTYTYSHINGNSFWQKTSTDDKIYDTNGVFSSILEFGPGFAIILNVTYTNHLTKKIFTYSSLSFENGVMSSYMWIHKMAALGTDPTLYYVQETMYLNTITTFSSQMNFGSHHHNDGNNNSNSNSHNINPSNMNLTPSRERLEGIQKK